MSEGWIKLHRSMRSTPILRKPIERFVFVELMMLAQHAPFKFEHGGRVIDLDPGQCVVSLRPLARELGVDHKTIRRILKSFQNRHMCTIKTSPLGTLVTLCNWSNYQGQKGDTSPASPHQPPQHLPTSSPHNKNEKNEKKLESGHRSESLTRESAPPGTSADRDHEKILISHDWQMTPACDDRLESLFRWNLGDEAYWRQVERFIDHHAEAGTMATQDQHERSLENWLKRSNSNGRDD